MINKDKETEMSQNTHNSSYREKLIEHLFVAELLKLSWVSHHCSLEIAKPEVDNAGYDLIGEVKNVIRHIQLKTSIVGVKTASQKVHTRLCEKPSGCVVWIYVNKDDLSLGPFRFFGDEPGKPLPSLDGFKVAKHSKGNKDGVKAERPSIRVIPKARFIVIKSIGELYTKLFSEISATECKIQMHHPVRDGRPPIPVSKEAHEIVEEQVSRSVDNDPIMEALYPIKREGNRSWVMLKLGCDLLLGNGHTTKSKSVQSSSKTFARKASEELGLSYNELLDWIEKNNLV